MPVRNVLGSFLITPALIAFGDQDDGGADRSQYWEMLIESLNKIKV